ncbi:MAG TPA: glycosyltransferase family 4 protein [Polyangiales bacterium]|nr:glycosyltransferase family 4 protein [Polyangiales bacterium]
MIVAAGRFDRALAQEIAQGREPRLDMFELQRALDVPAERMLDFGDVERCTRPDVRAVRKLLGMSAATAYLAVVQRQGADAIFTTGEDIGLPLAMLLKLRGIRASHTMIAHSLSPLKKRVFFRAGVGGHLDRVLCYATIQERLMLEELGLARSAVKRINYQADEHFFRPLDVPEEPDLVCSAGQLLRDYDTLIRATDGLPVRVRIAAGSPWIAKELRPDGGLPAHVDWRKYNRFELRELYARSSLAVVPIVQNDYQTGISTILEMMAMGKCVIASRTRGQTDTIIDNVNGVYVPPGDAGALRATIQRLLASPEERARLGRAARAYVEKEAGLDLFVDKITETVREAHQARFGASA